MERSIRSAGMIRQAKFSLPIKDIETFVASRPGLEFRC